MSPRALLLSPDDQAVSAITAVLQELSVACERPTDPVSAAKKLNSQSFDLVLVDCENLPAAKLIFDVCRRSHAATSIAIAIVDGRAGLPTAFRLGAELILTKPVAKDQARSTIRTAVNRLRKEEPAREAKPVEAISDAPAATASATLAQAAAVAANSPSVKEPIVAAPAKDPTPAESLSPTTKSTPAETAVPVLSVPKAPEASSSAKISSPAPPVAAPPAPVLESSNDPVLSELEHPGTTFQSPPLSSYEPRRQEKRGHGLLIAALVLALLGAGLYAAWMYQPGFREIVQAQLDRAMTLAGLKSAAKNTSAIRPVVSSQPVKAAVPQATAPATQPEAGSPGELPSASTAVASPSANVPVPAAPPRTANAPLTSNPGNASTASLAETSFTDAKDTVILSSKGAEKRLLRQVRPQYPAGSQRGEATVVLRALVDKSGAVEAVHLVEGNPELAGAAISAVKQWRYRPYVRDGKAQPFQTIVLVDF